MHKPTKFLPLLLIVGALSAVGNGQRRIKPLMDTPPKKELPVRRPEVSPLEQNLTLKELAQELYKTGSPKSMTGGLTFTLRNIRKLLNSGRKDWRLR